MSPKMFPLAFRLSHRPTSIKTRIKTGQDYALEGEGVARLTDLLPLKQGLRLGNFSVLYYDVLEHSQTYFH